MRIRVVALVLVLLVPAGCGQPDAQVATSPTSTATAQPVAAVASIGAVFLGDGPVHSCTGSILHSRTGFVDGPEPHQKRHMLRLWLKFPKPWPLSAEFPSHMGYKPAQDTPILMEAEA